MFLKLLPSAPSYLTANTNHEHWLTTGQDDTLIASRMSAFGGKADITSGITSGFCFCGEQARCQRFANEMR
jgi:hypothetical protein